MVSCVESHLLFHKMAHVLWAHAELRPPYPCALRHYSPTVYTSETLRSLFVQKRMLTEKIPPRFVKFLFKWRKNTNPNSRAFFCHDAVLIRVPVVQLDHFVGLGRVWKLQIFNVLTTMILKSCPKQRKDYRQSNKYYGYTRTEAEFYYCRQDTASFQTYIKI